MVLPEYKALLDLHDIPPHLFKETEVQKAVATFGTFVGSVPMQDPADLSKWSLVVAVSSLKKIPDELSMHDLSSEYIVPVKVRNWLRSPLYKAAELPRILPKFSKPPRQPPSSEPDQIHVSRKALFQICKGLDPRELPPEVLAIFSSRTNPPILTISQTEQLVSCPKLPQDTNRVAG